MVYKTPEQQTLSCQAIFTLAASRAKIQMDSGGDSGFIRAQVCSWPETRQLELIICELTDQSEPAELCLARLAGLAGPVDDLLRLRCDGEANGDASVDLVAELRQFCASRQDLRLLPILCWRDKIAAVETMLIRLLNGRPSPWTVGRKRKEQFRRILPLEDVCAQLCIRFRTESTRKLLAELKLVVGQDPSFSCLALTGRLRACSQHRCHVDCAYHRCQLISAALTSHFRDLLPPPMATDAAAAAAVLESEGRKSLLAGGPSDYGDSSSEADVESVCNPFPRPEEMPAPDLLLMSGFEDPDPDAEDSQEVQLPPIQQPQQQRQPWRPKPQTLLDNDYLSGFRDIRLANPNFINDDTPDRPYVHHS